jgi:hypothetical protein
MRALVIVASFALLLAAGPAGAQDDNPTTPGAIPNPGSYQGSMQLQQQERQQDMQTRQQYAPAPSYGGNGGGNYGGGGYRGGGGGGGPSSYGRNGGYGIPDSRCYNEVANIPELEPLRDKVSVGPVDANRTEILFINSRPTPDERALLRKWLAARHYCRTLIFTTAGAQTPMFRRADMSWGASATERLINRLINGELTYGEFNRQRALNGQLQARYWETH